MHVIREWWGNFFSLNTSPPRYWVDRYWGINGSPDWGKPAWPGWRKPPSFWNGEWPSRIVFFLMVCGPAVIVLFGLAPIINIWPGGF